MNKKILLTTCLIAGVLSFNAKAEDNYTTCYGATNCLKIRGHTNRAWTYYTVSNGKMIIYGPRETDENGDYISSASIASFAFTDRWVSANNFPSGVSEVEISGNITSIGDSAFRNATGLTTITIPGTVETIGGSAFANSSVQNVVIEEGVSTIEDSAFWDATNLRSITLPDSLTKLGNTVVGTNNYSNLKIFCNETSEGRCLNLATANSANISKYLNVYNVDENGVYSTIANGYRWDSDTSQWLLNYSDETQYYTSLNDLINNENSCSDLTTCKAIIMLSKEVCSNMDSCLVLAQSDNQGGSGNTTAYTGCIAGQNRRDCRIYTIEEANAVAGEKNRVSIRYR